MNKAKILEHLDQAEQNVKKGEIERIPVEKVVRRDPQM